MRPPSRAGPGAAAMRYARIEHLGLERGHRTLAISRKGGKVVTILLAPRTARAIDLAIGERTEGPVFRAVERRRLDWHGAGRIVRRTARCAGERQRPSRPTRCGTPSPPTRTRASRYAICICRPGALPGRHICAQAGRLETDQRCAEGSLAAWRTR